MDERRAARYARLYEQLKELTEDGKSPSLLSAMATLCAVLHAKMPHHLWTGFYFVANERELHVGPYQGPLACQILREKGVCLRAARTRRPVIVGDVHDDSDHIACDARARSEIAVPLLRGNDVVAVLDIDSTEVGQFDESDVAPLQQIVGLLTPYL